MFRIMVKLTTVLLLSSGILAGCSKDEQGKLVVSPAGSGANTQEAGRDGKALFKQYCASCHPEGGNVSDPERSLYGSVLKKRHIDTPDDIVRIMRHPMSRMIRFDQATLSDRDARAIAEFILATYK